MDLHEALIELNEDNKNGTKRETITHILNEQDNFIPTIRNNSELKLAIMQLLQLSIGDTYSDIMDNHDYAYREKLAINDFDKKLVEIFRKRLYSIFG